MERDEKIGKQDRTVEVCGDERKVMKQLMGTLNELQEYEPKK